MAPLVKRCASVTSGIAAVLLLAGCSEKKDLSPPPVNASPHEKLELIVTPEGHGTDYPVTVVVQYGNLSKSCSNIDYRYGLGGNIDYPKGDVSILGDKGVFVIYRDYYEPRGECSWKPLGVGIDIYAPNGRVANTGVSRSNFHAGFRRDIKCHFIHADGSVCLEPSAADEHIPGVNVTILVR
jgi:hypothetical protein